MNLLDNRRFLLELKKAIITGKPSFIVALALTVLLNSGFSYNSISRFRSSNGDVQDIDSVLSYLDEIIFIEANKPIRERQQEFLDKYNVDYFDMIKAVTEEIPGIGIDYSGAKLIKERSDFPEMVKDFNYLNNKKLKYIKMRYNINDEQFILMSRRMLNESGGYNYDEAYNCWTTLYNRIFSQPWIDELNNHGYDGYYIYDQFRYPGQFGYGEYIKEDFDDPTKWIGYYAGLDMLSSEEFSHDYTGFRASWTKGGVQLEEDGNKYRSLMEDRVLNPTLEEVVFEPTMSLKKINESFVIINDDNLTRYLVKDDVKNA